MVTSSPGITSTASSTRAGVNQTSGDSYGTQGHPADFSVDGDAGQLRLGAGATRVATMLANTARDVDLTFRVALDALPQGGSTFAYGVARRVANGTEYRFKLRIDATGAAWVQATRRIDGTETSVGQEARVPGVTLRAGRFVWVHARITGVDPTRLRMRAWADGDREPTRLAVRRARQRERPATVRQHRPDVVRLLVHHQHAHHAAFDDLRAVELATSTVPTPRPTPPRSPRPSRRLTRHRGQHRAHARTDGAANARAHARADPASRRPTPHPAHAEPHPEPTPHAEPHSRADATPPSPTPEPQRRARHPAPRPHPRQPDPQPDASPDTDPHADADADSA